MCSDISFMNENVHLNIAIYYNPIQIRGTFCIDSASDSGVWHRLRQLATSTSNDCKFTSTTIDLPWSSVLSIIRQFAQNQHRWNFRFKPDKSAKEHIDKFLTQLKRVRESRIALPQVLSADQIKKKLNALGFTKRELKSFQLRDLRKLVSLPNGANFSVPGAGKTTVTFALHLLACTEGQHLFIVGPKSSFPVWSEIVDECISKDAPEWVKEPFTILRDRKSVV